MKLTVSYGTAGNDRIGNFSSLPLYGGGTTADYLGLPGLRPTQTPNPNLTWEETAQLDLGIQTTFFKNIFTLNLNYYDKITSGLLLDVPFPPSEIQSPVPLCITKRKRAESFTSSSIFW